MAAAVERRMFMTQPREGHGSAAPALQLFTKVAPRRRMDAYGRDTTSYSDFLLSNTVFPTGVRAPLISDLQTRSSELTKEYMETTGAIVRHSWQSPKQEPVSKRSATRPDTVEEMAGPRNSPASMASSTTRNDLINLLPSADEPSHKGSSVDTSGGSDHGPSKNTAASKSGQGETFTIQAFVGPKADEGKGKDVAVENGKRQEQGNASASKKDRARRKRSDGAVPRASANGKVTTSEMVLSRSAEDRDQRGKLAPSTPATSQRASLTRASGRTTSRGTTLRDSKSSLRLSGMSASSLGTPQKLREYSWQSREKPTKSRSDARDTLYILTYCPEERPLRWRESTLPGVESQHSGSETHTHRARLDTERGREEGEVTHGKVPQHKGRVIPLRTSQLYRTAEEINKQDPFEVKRLEEPGQHQDQRDTLRGKTGCLHSKVKQCIRLVRHHEQQRNSSKVDRPLKKESCNYRPFSTTSIRTPAPTPDVNFRKEHRSTDAYKAYKDRESRRRTHTKSAGTLGSGVLARNNTAASNYFDVDSRVVQSVMDVNRPSTAGTSGVSSDVIQVPTVNAWMSLVDDESSHHHKA